MKYTAENPVLRGFHPDPCIIYVNGIYYMATSTFEYYPGVTISASTDLSNWETVSRPLDRPSLLDMRGDASSTGIWAPDLSYADGKFWLVYTNQRQWTDAHLKDTENYLTTCDKIDGRWSDPVALNNSGFDPSLFHDDDGRKYLLNMCWDYRFDSDAERFCGILLQEYDDKNKKLTGDPTLIFRGTEKKITEAPHLYKRNGYYYLLTAEGGTGLPHCATLARSKNIKGPYELHPYKHILTSYGTDCRLQKAGHASICEGKNGEWILAHLCARPLENGRCPLGRETALQNVEWRDDGWLYLSNGTVNPSDTFDAYAPQKLRIKENVYEFSSSELHPDLLFLRQKPDDGIFDLKARPGYLRIRGKKSIMSLFDQSMIFRRVEDFDFEAETEMDFHPSCRNHWAGLAYRYSETNQHYLYVSYDGEKACRVLLKIAYDDGRFSYEKIAVLDPDTQIKLKVVSDCKTGRFYYSTGGEWLQAGSPFDASKLSDEYNRPLGFTGSFIGIGCQDTSDGSKTADFKYLIYRKTGDE